MAENIDWFLGRDGQQYGPIKNDEMQTLARLGQLRSADLLWRAGLADWRPASELFDLTAPAEPARAAQPAVNAPAAAQSAAAQPGAVSSAETTPAVADTQALSLPAAVSPAGVDASSRRDDQRQSDVTRGAQRQPANAREIAVAPRPKPARPSIAAGRSASPFAGKRQRRLLLAAAVSVAAVSLVAGVYATWDDLVAALSTGQPSIAGAPSPGKPGAIAGQTPGVRDAAPRPAFAAGRVWGQVQADYPEWFGERMREAERIRRDGTDRAPGDPAVNKYLSESLVSLRRNHASDALSASHDSIRRVAVAFVENLTSLSAESTDVCYDFISHGEASDAVVKSLASQPISAGIDAQLSAVFTAIREGRAKPVAHLPPRKSDYDILADELVKLGWADNDLKVFSDPRLLSRASPEQVCRLVKDWFRAHLAIGDPGTQLRLLVESLRPVVAG